MGTLHLVMLVPNIFFFCLIKDKSIITVFLLILVSFDGSCRLPVLAVGIQKKQRTLPPPLKNMNLYCPDTLMRKSKNILSCYHSASFGHADFNFGDHAGNSMWK